MSVWPNTVFSSFPLCGTEGALVLVSVSVEPRNLELALDALAQLSYPINPQIYHDGAVLTSYADGRQEREPATIIEFPAYTSWLNEIRRVWHSYGFQPDCLSVADMLEGIHSDAQAGPAPAGAGYEKRILIKHGRQAAVGAT
jgi:hypothetical protein